MTQVTKSTSLKDFFGRDDVKNKFTEIMGKRGASFANAVLTIASSNTMFKDVDPVSLYMGALTAATLGLEVNPNIGHAYLIPYNSSQGKQAQFQIGYKGLIQLAQRSGQYATINAVPVYDGELQNHDKLTGHFDLSGERKGDNVIGYAAYFRLLNGFEKREYWSKERVLEHAKRFSKTFSNGPWKTDFDAMALKTVLKLLIGKYGPLSVEMQMAVKFDQAVVNDIDAQDVTYADNDGTPAYDWDALAESLEAAMYDMKPTDYEVCRAIVDAKEEASYDKVLKAIQAVKK